MSRLLNAKELAEKLEISEATFHRRRRLKLYKSFEVVRPIGQKRYSAALVERFLDGQSVVKFGEGRRSA